MNNQLISKGSEEHPINRIEKVIEEQGVIVIDEVTNMPLYGKPHISPHLVISLCKRGYLKAEYDMRPVEFHPLEISIIYPNHIILTHETSDDYLATLVVVSNSWVEEVQHRSTHLRQLEYQKEPAFTLNEQQHEILLNAIQLLKGICLLKCPTRKSMLLGQLDVLSLLIDEYRSVQKPMSDKLSTDKQLFYHFYDAIVKHYRESHEIKYYANLLCLSPKYFASVIKQATGISASEWINNYIIVQAKSLLSTQTDLSIQKLSEELGFPEQSSFSRFFKHHTGLSPTEYRERIEFETSL